MSDVHYLAINQKSWSLFFRWAGEGDRLAVLTGLRAPTTPAIIHIVFLLAGPLRAPFQLYYATFGDQELKKGQ